MGELQTLTRAEILGALTVKRPVRRPDSATPAVPDRPRRPAPRGRNGRPLGPPPGGGPVVDVDMGIGREYGYRDPRRLGPIVVTHAAVRESADLAAVGAAMARIRYAAGVTQQALALALGTTKDVVSRWERGVAPVPSHVRATWADVCARTARQKARGRA